MSFLRVENLTPTPLVFGEQATEWIVLVQRTMFNISVSRRPFPLHTTESEPAGVVDGLLVLKIYEAV